VRRTITSGRGKNIASNVAPGMHGRKILAHEAAQFLKNRNGPLFCEEFPVFPND